jgi:amino acid permease
MYVQPNGPNGSFRQPGGPGTQVFPAQVTSVDYFAVTPFSELSGIQVAGCGHYQDYPTLQNEYDEDTGEKVVLIICSVCSYIQYATTPENAYSTVFNPQVVI